jgi:hypothetical protein
VKILKLILLFVPVLRVIAAQGTVYFCEAIPGQSPIEIRPLRGKNMASVAAVCANLLL